MVEYCHVGAKHCQNCPLKCKKKGLQSKDHILPAHIGLIQVKGQALPITCSGCALSRAPWSERLLSHLLLAPSTAPILPVWSPFAATHLPLHPVLVATVWVARPRARLSVRERVAAA